MDHGVPTPLEHRDRGLARLNDMTVAVAIGATGLLGTFAVVAETTVPGHSDGSVLVATGSGDQSRTGAGMTSSNDASGGPSLRQPCNNAFSKAGSSAPVAVSGGSR